MVSSLHLFADQSYLCVLAAGQRCMAISVGQFSLLVPGQNIDIQAAVFVGAAQQFIPELVTRASKLQVNQGFEKGAEL